MSTYLPRLCAREVWGAGRKPTIRRDLPEVDALSAFEASLAYARPVNLVARAWRLIADFFASGEAVAPETLRIELDAPDGPSLRMRWRSAIHAGWSAGPVLYLDATLIPSLVEQDSRSVAV